MLAALQIVSCFPSDHTGQQNQADEVGDGHEGIEDIREGPDEVEFGDGSDEVKLYSSRSSNIFP